MTGADSLALFALAGLCPERNGGVVFQARALYSEVYSDLSMFNDDSCLIVDSTYIAATHSNGNGNSAKVKMDEEQSYKAFPNPNEGNFVLQQYLQDSGVVKVDVYDAVGRDIYQNELVFILCKV
jgi:hypothetical protein